MIDVDGVWREIACDECGTLSGDAFDMDEFRQMVTAAKRAGWIIQPTSDGWGHVCPDCSTPDLDDAFDDEEPPRYDPDIEALLGPSKDHDHEQ